MPSWTSHSSGDCDRRAVRHCRRFHRRRSVRVGAVEALYKVWVDANKTEHRREVTWKMVAKSATKSDCESRRVSEARAEYDTLAGKGIRVSLAGSKVGFEQRNTRFRHAYRNFECRPDTADPRGPKGK
jgi:hypothetical protein